MAALYATVIKKKTFMKNTTRNMGWNLCSFLSQTYLIVIDQAPRIHNKQWNKQSHWWAGVRQSPAMHTESKGALENLPRQWRWWKCTYHKWSHYQKYVDTILHYKS
jgi:hypothetical protein